MDLPIRAKLMIAFTSIAILVTLISFVGIVLTFRIGFINYLNEVREMSLQEVSRELNDSLKIKSDWEDIASDRHLWQMFLKQSQPELQRTFGNNFDHPHATHFRGEPPEEFDFSRKHHFDKRSKYHLPPLKTHWILLNADRQVIYGKVSPANNLYSEPVFVDSELVGYLGINKLERVHASKDKSFIDKQIKYFLFVTIIAITVAVVFAFVIAKWMTGPLQKLTLAMTQFMRRDYSAQVDYQSQDEIGHLTKSFNALVKSFEQYETSQQQWIADISHELRTPISTLKGEMEALQDGIRPLNMERIDSLQEEILRLQKIVEDLHQLCMSDLGALKYQFSDVSVSQIIKDVVEGHKNQLENYEVNVHGVEDSPVYGDSDRLFQLFRNLLQNTIRYTNIPGRLDIAINLISNNKLEILWQDSEPGVDQAALPKLFDRLYREEESRNRSQGGSGLGLSICEAIVEAHKGKINAKESDLGGLAIVIQLPCVRG
jgi:two-component system sensor histidine kinase BaeS